MEGTILSEGEVTIAPTGEVKGTIEAKHLIVTGRVLGVFKIKECLEIHGTGYVEGEVEVGSLVVDEGGTLQGNCTRRGVERLEKAARRRRQRLRALPDPPGPAHGHHAPPPCIPPRAGPRKPPADRHVFNMANGVPSLPPAGEHAYSKTKL